MAHRLAKFYKIKLTAVAVVTMMASSNLAALGLGALEVQSNLDQPLNGVIELRVADGDDLNSLQVAIASKEDFASLGIDYPGYMDDIELSFDDSGDTKVLRVISNDVIIKEPFIHLLVKVDWSGGSFLREYTALIDPPVYAAQTPQIRSEPRTVGTDQSYQAGQLPELAVDDLDVETAQESIADVEEVEIVTDEVFSEVTAESEEAEAEDSVTSDEQSPGFDSELTQLPTDAQYGPVAAGESLGLIAEDLQRQFPDLSIFQIMKVLFEENRSAFINDNINGLMKGAILNLGDLNTIRAVDIAEGKEFFREQLREWDPALLETDADDGDGGLRVAQDEYAFADELGSSDSSLGAGSGGETFQVGAGSNTQSIISGAQSSNRDGEIIALKEQITELESALSSSSLENQELAERISLLEGQLEDMNRLISLNVEDADLASLESTLARQNNANDLSDTNIDAASDAVVGGEIEPLDSPDALLADAQLDDQLPDEADPMVEPVDLDAESVVSIDDATVSSSESVVTLFKEPSLFEKVKSSVVDQGIGRILVAVGALLLGGLALLLYRRRRADEEFEISMLSIETHSVNDGTGTTEETMDNKSRDRETSFLTVYSDSDAVVQADEVDPVAEADVYIAYGRDEQAEEVLLDGIVAKPNRIDIKQKLLSLYHKNNNVEGFERIAEEMYSQKNFLTPEVWQEISLMGKGIAPKNPLFDVSASEILVGDVAEAPDQDAGAASQATTALKDQASNANATEIDKVADSDAVRDDEAKVGAVEKAGPDAVVDADMEAQSGLVTVDDDESQAVDFALAEDDASINLINFDDGRSEISELDEVEINALLADDDGDEDEDGEEKQELVDQKPTEEKATDKASAGEPEDNADSESAIDYQADADHDADLEKKVQASPSSDQGDSAPPDDGAPGEALEFERIEAPNREVDDNFSLTASKEVSDLDVDDDYDETRTQYELAKVFVDLGDEDGARKILDDIIAGTDNDEEVLADASKLLESINR